MSTLQKIGELAFIGLALMLAPVTARAQIAVNTCGQELSKPGVYQLVTNIDCSGTFRNGITSTASDVIFHLASHIVSSADCDTSKDINGIFVGGTYSGIHIDGGRLSGFNDGIVLSSSKSTVVGMTVEKACVFGIAL